MSDFSQTAGVRRRRAGGQLTLTVGALVGLIHDER